MPVKRRSFLATSAALGAAATTPRHAPARVAEADPDDWISRTKAELPTPALLVDLDALEANIAAMATHAREHGRGHRPHAKTHKCPAIARLQVAAGARGNCAATVPEAEALAAAGIPGILLTSPILDPRKIARIARLAQTGSEVMVAVGHPRQVELLEEAAAAGQATLDVLVDVDVGDRRTGVPPGPPALELARLVDRGTHLRLRGIQAYSGSSSHVAGFDRRRDASRAAMAQAVATRELFERHGLEAGVLSGGSTGTYNIDSEIDGITELQVGSYVFMDVNYRKVGGRGGPVYDDFAPSLTVLTTVVSATHPGRVSLDAGIKAFSTDSGDLPESVDRPASWAYGRGGDEFGVLTAADGATLPGLGERLEFYVPHCDPTVNLYDRIYATRGGRVEAVWPVIARREAP